MKPHNALDAWQEMCAGELENGISVGDEEGEAFGIVHRALYETLDDFQKVTMNARLMLAAAKHPAPKAIRLPRSKYPYSLASA